MKQRIAHHTSLTIYQIIALAFLAVILGGAFLLSLPAASRSSESCGLLTALFTATSATCVTGLALTDTWTQWSSMGQGVLLFLMQVGGLGFMSVASILIFTLRKRINLRQLRLMAQSIGSENLHEIWGVQKRLMLGSVLVEAVGAAILFLRFLPRHGPGRALWLGIFHSVSAYCNAGFDLLGVEEPGTSITLYGTDPTVCLTLAFLIIIGGLGFLVWDELLRKPNPRKWSTYARLVLITTAGLLIIGTAGYLIMEWNNPATLGPMDPMQKLLAAFFQSATTRTAGFAGIDQGAMTDPSKAFTMLLMFVGGSSGSTAGGLKTVTFLVLLLFLSARATGRNVVRVFGRTVSDQQIMDTLTLFGLMIILCFVGGMTVSGWSGVSFTDGLFESVSALATVGLSTGITGSLSTGSKWLIILYMYLGRVGILTLTLGFFQSKKPVEQFTTPTVNLLIG